MNYSLKFWKSFHWENVTKQPSTFAEFCMLYMIKGKLLDICCGNGRDSDYFKNNSLQVASFEHDTLNLEDEIHNFSLDETFDYVYCRFVLHSVPENLEDYILINSNHILRDGGLFFIEVRSDKGKVPDDTPHYRRLINKEVLKEKLINLNFEIVSEQESDGLSVYKGEDPILIRIVGRKIGDIQVNSKTSFNEWENVELPINPELSAHLLLKTKYILDSHKIPFLLVFGTLLGAYRDKKFIEYDTDVDIAFVFKYINKVKQLIDEGYFAIYGIILIRDNFPTLYSLRYKEDYLDMYFFKWSGGKYVCGKYRIASKQIMAPPSEINFLDQTFKTVNNIELYLAKKYNNWKVRLQNKHART